MPTEKPSPVIRLRDREWALQRVDGRLPWQVTHLPTRVVFRDSSQAEARRRITAGYYGQQVADRLRPEPANPRQWWKDSRGTWHLWVGAAGDWHCSEHEQVCSPITPLTVDDILHAVASDPGVSDDSFVLIRQAAEGRL